MTTALGKLNVATGPAKTARQNFAIAVLDAASTVAGMPPMAYRNSTPAAPTAPNIIAVVRGRPMSSDRQARRNGSSRPFVRHSMAISASAALAAIHCHAGGAVLSRAARARHQMASTEKPATSGNSTAPANIVPCRL
jgi:hypothetical protein